MASLNIRNVSIIMILVAAIFVMQLVLISADQSGEYRTERYDPRTPPTPQGNMHHGMIPPELSPPPPVYT
nr:hypothetical protein LSAT_3X56841 [Tanacetum cinerariifolium]